MYRDGDEEVVVSLDATTGATNWEHRYQAEIWPDMTRAFGLGPNATPLIVGDRIISIGIDGQMRCLDLASGEVAVEARSAGTKFGRRKRDEEYGYSNSPMHYKGKIIVLVGGDRSRRGGIRSGGRLHVVEERARRSQLRGDHAHHPRRPGPVRLLLAGRSRRTRSFNGQDALAPPDGVQQRQPPDPHRQVRRESISGSAASFPRGEGGCSRSPVQGGAWTARRIWFETNLRASHWTSIRLGDFIYGSTGGNEISLLTAFNWRTGEVAWRQRGFHKAQSLYADGKLLFLDEGRSTHPRAGSRRQAWKCSTALR